jgi:hypothetical protein
MIGASHWECGCHEPDSVIHSGLDFDWAPYTLTMNCAAVHRCAEQDGANEQSQKAITD